MMDIRSLTNRSEKRRATGHLKLVPETRELRDRLQQACRDYALTLDRSRPMAKDQLEQASRDLLAKQGLGEGYVGWIMVVLSSEFWRDSVASVPPERRLFLLPHCLKHAQAVPPITTSSV